MYCLSRDVHLWLQFWFALTHTDGLTFMTIKADTIYCHEQMQIPSHYIDNTL